MIYLYAMPSFIFNSPQINIPLIKGYFNRNNINSKQIDLAFNFLVTCINSNYIQNNLKKFYNQLSEKNKNIIKNLDDYVLDLRTPDAESEKIIIANEKLMQYFNLLCSYYNIKWNRRDLVFNTNVSSISDVLKLAMDEKNKLFDPVLMVNFNIQDKDIFYMSVQYPFQLIYAIRFSKIIKSKNSKIKIILGGDYITHIIKNAKELLEKCKYIDSIVFFGDYKPLLELIKLYQNNNTNIKIPNTFVRSGSKIICNELHKINPKDVFNNIPSFEDLQLNKYLSNIIVMPLTLNYGCYHSQCTFCSRYFYYNGYGRYNLNMILNFIKEQYFCNKIEAIYFMDECVPPDILITVAKYLIENNIKIKWMVETRIDKKLNDKGVAELLYKSGCCEISFGIESYNKRILSEMNKKIDLKIAKNVMKIFYNSGISVSATFMIGYPTENIINIIKTLTFINKFKYLDTFGISIFNYMRNSIIVNHSKLDEAHDLNLIYRTNDDNYEFYHNIIKKFNSFSKIKKYLKVRDKLLYRTEYLFLKREKYSLNFRK